MRVNERTAQLPRKTRKLTAEVTGRKKPEPAVREADQKYRTLFHSNSTGIAITTLDGEVVDANQAYQDMVGYTLKELEGTNVRKLTPKKWHKLEAEATKHLMSEGYGIFEKEHIRKDGTIFSVSLSAWLIRDGQGNPAGIGVFVKDITERKKAEPAVREADQKHRTLFHSNSTGIAITTLDGEVVDANQAYQDMVGYTLKELSGTNVRKLTPKKWHKLEAEATKHLMSEGYGIFEKEYIRKDGTIFPVSLSAWLIRDGQGNPAGIGAFVKDTAQHQQPEKTLRKADARYKALFDRTLYCVYVHDFEGKFLDANDAALNLLGYTREELPSLNMSSLLGEDQLPTALKTLEEIQQTGRQKRTTEYKLTTKDGDYVWVETEASLIYRQGKPYAIQGIARDITERKRAEEKLPESEEKYRTILESVTEGYHEIDLAGNLTFFNDSLCRTLGYTRDELLGMNNRQYMDEENAEKVYQIFNEVYRTGKPCTRVDWEVIRKDGTKLSISSSVSLIRDSQGKPIGFRGLSRDITERKKAEEALQESGEKLRAMFESVTDGITIVDLEGKVVDVNEAQLRIFGYGSKEAVIGQNAFDSVAEKDRAKAVEGMGKALEEKLAAPAEYTLLAKDGREFEAEITVSLLNDNSANPAGLVCVIRDITERKRAQKALEESEEKYRTQFEQALDAIFVADAETGIMIDCNREACKLVGRKKSELVGQHQRILHPPQKTRGVTKTFKQHLGEKQGRVLETQVITKKGEIKEVAIKANVIELRGKKLLQAIFRDVTERKRAEEALEEAKTRFEALFETANELIITTDAEGWILRANKEVERLSGYSKKELIGKSILEIAYPEDKDKYVQFWQDILNGLSPHYELRTISKTGVVSNLLASGNAIEKDRNIVEIQYNAKDITEEKQAEEKLRESEEKYRTILESITEDYYEIDLAGNLAFFNDSLCQSLGYTRDEMMGMNNRQYMDEENAAKVYQVFNEVYRTGKPCTRADWDVIRKDGTKLSISSSASLIKDSQDKVIGFRGLSRDVTQQKKAAEELRESEEKYRTILENVVGGYYEVDLAGSFTFVNKTICIETGYSRDELLAMNNKDYMDKETAKKVLERFGEVYTTGQPAREFEFEIIRKDGTKLAVSASVSLITDPQGQPTGFRGIVMDITERKQAQEKLQKSEERYRSLFESATDGIFTMDLQTRFTSGNRKAEEMCGYSKDELIGEYATLILPEEEIPRMADAFKKVLKGETDTYETRIITKNGELLPVEITSSPIEIDGKIIGTMGMARDITERKRAEQTLRGSEEKYRQLTEEINDAIYTVDQDGNVTYVSPVIEWLTGYSPSEMMGRSFAEFFYEEDLPRAVEDFERVLSGQSTEDEYRFRIKSGEIRWLGTSNRAIFAGDDVVGARGTIMDVTKRKLAEQASEEARTRFEDLFETANELIITTDPEGWVLHANKEVEKLSGLSKKELIGQSILNIAYPEDVPKYIQFWKDILDGLAPRYELRAISAKKPGNIRYLLASASAVTKEGKIVEIQYNAKDISEEKQAEEKLRESEKKYRTILENMTDGYFEVDIAGNLTFFNNSMCEIIGYPRDKMMGMNNRKYMDKENARKVYQTFNKIYVTGKPARGLDWEITRKDGTKGFVEASISLVRNAQGEPTGFRGVVRDITERKQMEKEKDELQQRAQLASRLSVVGEMASGIVHEINNPLTSVIGFAEMLAHKDLPEDAREYATIINNEGKRVANIAGRLLNFARHQKAETVYTDINKLIEGTLGLQTYEMTTGNIKVTTELDPHLPQTMADPGQLQQVFLNIMLNARTAMRAAHGGGKFLVKTEALDDTIQISLEDDGPGIPKKNLNRIFDPFFTTRKTGEGTGLGLSICQGIINSHHGKIYAESTLGKGATFIIELPVVALKRKVATTANHNANIVWR